MNRQLRYGDADEAGMSARRIEHIRRLGAGWVERGEAASLALLVARRGVVVLHEAYGRLGPEPEAPPLPLDAIYPLASLTKPITATLVMCLVEDGLLGLNRPVQEYVPEFTGDGKDAVMVHHLLTHTSGITPEVIGAYAALKQREGVLKPDEQDCPGISLMPLDVRGDRGLYDVPLAVAPGSEMQYCNLNYFLLGDIVGRVAGQPAERFAKERVFAPLGMVDTRFEGVDPGRVPRLVRRSADNPFAVLDQLNVVRWAGGAGSATSTAWDIGVFGQMFLNHGRYGDARVLSPASVTEMTRDQIPGVSAVYGTGERFPKAGWGYGWNIKIDKREGNRSCLVSPSTFQHGGAGGVALEVDPERELVVVYFSVETGGQIGEVPQWCSDHFTDAVIATIAD